MFTNLCQNIWPHLYRHRYIRIVSSSFRDGGPSCLATASVGVGLRAAARGCGSAPRPAWEDYQVDTFQWSAFWKRFSTRKVLSRVSSSFVTRVPRFAGSGRYRLLVVGWKDLGANCGVERRARTWQALQPPSPGCVGPALPSDAQLAAASSARKPEVSSRGRSQQC